MNLLVKHKQQFNKRLTGGQIDNGWTKKKIYTLLKKKTPKHNL